jgi:hypothetical protein
MQSTARFVGATESDVAFTVDSQGCISFKEKPSLMTVTFSLPFTLDDQTVKTAALDVKTIVGPTIIRKSSFILSSEFPLQVEGRVQSRTMVHLRVRNACAVPLYVENLPWGRVCLRPDECVHVLHERAVGQFAVDVREEGGPVVRHSWNVDDTIMARRIFGAIDGSPPFPVGASLNLEIELPPGPYKVLPSEDFVVCGKVREVEFAGGTVRLQIIPIRIGTLTLPAVEVGELVQRIYPFSAQVTAAGLLNAGPWVVQVHE